ncbi:MULTISPECIES: hypothetical protein [Sandaracinus]|uniref:hypothetical protein n=1 Tax=Sandaracinus TaxID=1055688 RepID=UPI0019D4B1A1|nr:MULTISPECIES: hypothetical protein [Sandaracinus]QRN75795.1 Hypothetical protein MSR10575_88820 [Sandaracinus sp.]UJR87314.1 Hypothetical protein I5071_1060 [Sandaracinus amylolyticus]
MTYLIPLVALVAVVAFMVLQRQRLAQAGQTYAPFELSKLAPRLGLQIVNGDPGANIMLAPHNTVGTRISDDKPYEWNVRLQGSPRGRPVDFLYYHRRERQTGLVEIKYTYYDDAFIAVQLRPGAPEFELVSNQSSLGAISRRHPWPVQRSGDPNVGREFTIAANDPSVGAKLAPFLSRFDPALRAYGIHLESHGGWLRFRADGKHTSGNFYFIEQIVPALEQIADRLEQP